MDEWAQSNATGWVIERTSHAGNTAYPLLFTFRTTRKEAIKAWVAVMYGAIHLRDWRDLWRPWRRRGIVRAVKSRITEVDDG